MAYQVDKFNGTFLTSVEDGTIDNSTDIRFVGKNYAGYGEVQNENFLHMLENFANTSAPPRVITGQIWYDSANQKLKFYNGSRFKNAGGAEVAATAPSGLSTGEFWWDNSSNQLYTWSGADFVLVGPEVSDDVGSSAAVAQSVKDTSGTNHTILKLNAGGKTVGIVSRDEFTLDNGLNPIADFTTIKKGFTLANTNVNGISADDYIYWGTASNSLKLGGIAADQFIQKGSVQFDTQISFLDPGFTLGNDNDLRVRVVSDDLIIENQLGNDINFRITVTQNTDERDVLVLTSNGPAPGLDNSYALGALGSRWSNVYAVMFNGNLTGSVTGDTTGLHTGNVVANDTQVMIDATSKQIGYDGASLRGVLTGSLTGNVTGTATNANRLDDTSPAITVPTTVDKTSVVVRDNLGKVYATNFEGNALTADRLKIDDSATDTDPNYRSAKTTATANTIAARDGSGDISANLFKGTATAARYADLAEKYLTDRDYEPGTVVSVGGSAEVTACTRDSHPIGVVSTNPAYMMNSELEGGTYIALKGRVPVKVGGKVNKGDTLVAGNNGYAVAGSNAHVFAVALDTNEDDAVAFIEAVIL